MLDEGVCEVSSHCTFLLSVKLVGDNIVGTIIFLSLILWILVSSVVHCFVSPFMHYKDTSLVFFHSMSVLLDSGCLVDTEAERRERTQVHK